MELIKTAEPYNQAPALRARLVRLSDANIERTTAASLRSAPQPTASGRRHSDETPVRRPEIHLMRKCSGSGRINEWLRPAPNCPLSPRRDSAYPRNKPDCSALAHEREARCPSGMST